MDPYSAAVPPKRRSRRTALFVTLGVVVVLVVTAIVLGTNHKSNTASGQSQTLIDQTHHFKITVPAGWSQITSADQRQQIKSRAAQALPSAQASAIAGVQYQLFAVSHSNGSSESLNLVVGPSNDATSPDDVVSLKDDLAHELETIGVTVDQKTILDYAGQTALRLDYHGTVHGVTQMGIQVYLVHDKQGYVVTATTDATGTDDLADILKTMSFTD